MRTGGYGAVLKLAVEARRRNRARDVIVERRVDFGDDPRQHILFLYDNHPLVPRRNAVLFVHGGAWTLGSPEGYRFAGQYFARLGFPTIMAGYRLAPRVKIHDQLDDIFTSLQTGLAAAAARGFGDLDIIVSGQSAGSHLATLLVYDRAAQAAHHVDQNIFSGLAILSAPLDLGPWENRGLRDFFANLVAEGDWESIDPIRHVRGGENIPVLCIHGDRDPIVPIANSCSFVDWINAKTVDLAELFAVAGGRHTDVMAMFLKDKPATIALTAWLEAVDKRGSLLCYDKS